MMALFFTIFEENEESEKTGSLRASDIFAHFYSICTHSNLTRSDQIREKLSENPSLNY